MKQTKIRKPILSTSIWILNATLVYLIAKYCSEPTDILLATYFCASLYTCAWWFWVFTERFDRYNQRDMNKYICNEIKTKEERIKSLQDEIYELKQELK